MIRWFIIVSMQIIWIFHWFGANSAKNDHIFVIVVSFAIEALEFCLNSQIKWDRISDSIEESLFWLRNVPEITNWGRRTFQMIANGCSNQRSDRNSKSS